LFRFVTAPRSLRISSPRAKAGNREWMVSFASTWSGIPAERDHEAELFVATDRLRRRLNDTFGVPSRWSDDGVNRPAIAAGWLVFAAVVWAGEPESIGLARPHTAHCRTVCLYRRQARGSSRTRASATGSGGSMCIHASVTLCWPPSERCTRRSLIGSSWWACSRVMYRFLTIDQAVARSHYGFGPAGREQGWGRPAQRRRTSRCVSH